MQETKTILSQKTQHHQTLGNETTTTELSSSSAAAALIRIAAYRIDIPQTIVQEVLQNLKDEFITEEWQLRHIVWQEWRHVIKAPIGLVTTVRYSLENETAVGGSCRTTTTATVEESSTRTEEDGEEGIPSCDQCCKSAAHTDDEDKETGSCASTLASNTVRPMVFDSNNNIVLPEATTGGNNTTQWLSYIEQNQKEDRVLSMIKTSSATNKSACNGPTSVNLLTEAEVRERLQMKYAASINKAIAITETNNNHNMKSCDVLGKDSHHSISTVPTANGNVNARTITTPPAPAQPLSSTPRFRGGKSNKTTILLHVDPSCSDELQLQQKDCASCCSTSPLTQPPPNRRRRSSTSHEEFCKSSRPSLISLLSSGELESLYEKDENSNNRHHSNGEHKEEDNDYGGDDEEEYLHHESFAVDCEEDLLEDGTSTLNSESLYTL